MFSAMESALSKPVLFKLWFGPIMLITFRLCFFKNMLYFDSFLSPEFPLLVTENLLIAGESKIGSSIKSSVLMVIVVLSKMIFL